MTAEQSELGMRAGTAPTASATALMQYARCSLAKPAGSVKNLIATASCTASHACCPLLTAASMGIQKNEEGNSHFMTIPQDTSTPLTSVNNVHYQADRMGWKQPDASQGSIRPAHWEAVRTGMRLTVAICRTPKEPTLRCEALNRS